MNPSSIIQQTRALVGQGADHAARAWALSWRVVRFLERAEETARQNRIDALNPHSAVPVGDPIKFLAARCIQQAVPKPTQGEAATVAAVADAVSLARSAADVLYREHVASAPKAPPEVLADPRRLKALSRTRSITIRQADEYLAEHAADEDAERAHKTAAQRERREAFIMQGVEERRNRIARRRLVKGIKP